MSVRPVWRPFLLHSVAPWRRSHTSLLWSIRQLRLVRHCCTMNFIYKPLLGVACAYRSSHRIPQLMMTTAVEHNTTALQRDDGWDVGTNGLSVQERFERGRSMGLQPRVVQMKNSRNSVCATLFGCALFWPNTTLSFIREITTEPFFTYYRLFFFLKKLKKTNKGLRSFVTFRFFPTSSVFVC